MRVLILYIILSVILVNGQEQTCKSIPETPLVGKRFQLICRIQVIGDEAPLLTFDQNGFEVLGKKIADASIRSTVKNGQITTFKEKKYVYDLIAAKKGRKKIFNLTIDNNGEIRKLRDLYINVIRSRLSRSDYFAIAIPSKKTVYVGEGFDVNYYLYYRVKKTKHGIEEWPKINNFYKRDLSLLGNENIESVEYEGRVFQRVLLYSIKLFAEKEGEHSLSPIKVNIQYKGTKKFGMLGRYSSGISKSIRSKLVSIKVASLPTKGVPKSFGGLVGEHSFDIKVHRKRFIVNEPIEVKLTIRGNGNLEQLVAPQLYRNGNLEEFDKQSEILKDEIHGYKKIIDYTYLARSEIDFKKKSVKVGFFSLREGKYKTAVIKLPPLLIRGVTRLVQKNTSSETKSVFISLPLTRLVAPVFEVNKMAEYGLLYFNMLLFLIVLFLFLSLVDWRDKMPGVDQELANICRTIKKKGPKYSLVFNLMAYLREDKMAAETSLKKIIGHSSLSDDSKQYFVRMVDLSESLTYDQKKGNEIFSYRKKFFQEFVGYVTRVKSNENYNQDT